MPEIPDRLCDNELARQPAANTAKLYYTATATAYFGMGVCNTTGGDVHVTIFLIPASQSWIDGAPPPSYTAIVSRQLVEADAVQSSPWEMPNCVLKIGDKIAVMTDIVGANFNAHGIKQT